MESLRDVVDEHGVLNEALLQNREAIYKGRNGKYVERIRISDNSAEQSIIFKPLTNQESLGKEEWVYRHIVPRLPAVYFPRLLCTAAGDAESEAYWIMLEDLGKLEHSFDTEILMSAAGAMPYWHLIPLDVVPDTFAGHTPKLEAIWSIVTSHKKQITDLLVRQGMGLKEAEFLRQLLQLERPPHAVEEETVVSHGDLYPLNIAQSGSGALIILDWEYIHRNSVYWDLYNAIDITSPSYRRPIINSEDRIAVLETYITVREQLGKPLRSHFIAGYHYYCLVYSLWIMMLVENDLQSNRFNQDGLLRQREETLQIVHQMLDYHIG